MTDPDPLPDVRGVGMLSNTMAAIGKLPTHVNAAYVMDADRPVLLGDRDT